MQTERHSGVDKDLRNLRRFSAPLESLEAWDRLFCSKGLKETPAIDRYPGFGDYYIYKARVVPLKENCGRSKGYRVVFKIYNNGNNEICRILFFSRHGIYKSEGELLRIVKSRLTDF